MSETDPTSIRRTVHFSGRVQGVFFRATTRSVAASFQVTGFVRNLPDGRVQLVAEGSEAELARFVAAIEEAMRDNITQVDASDRRATGEYSSFTIAY